MEKYFRVLRVYDGPQLGEELTKHYAERSDRVKEMHKGIKLHCAFVVDKNHPNGLEVHEVYSDGTIKIYNLRTGKFITVLYGRVFQIIRYYNELCMPLPYDILCEAEKNEKQGRNNL